MKVPLSARAFVSDGVQLIEVWKNGKSDVVRAPLLPYVYSKEPLAQANCKSIDGYSLLNDTQYSGPLYCCEFKNTKDKYDSDIAAAMEARVRLLDRIYIDQPHWILKWKNTDELRILSLDFEMHTNGQFPDAERDIIIAAGLQLNDNDIEIYMADNPDDDSGLIRLVVERIRELDPDIIVTYNGNNFDMPYFIQRMKYNFLPSASLSRDGSDVFFKYDQDDRVEEVVIGGRIHYDIFMRSVRNGQKIVDQNLFKVSPKHYDMKTVARIYKCPDVIQEPKEIMSNMRSIINTQRLADYLTSDIRCTTFLRKIYLPALIALAEYLSVPLNTVVTMSPSYTGTIIFARKFHDLKIIGDMTVAEAHPYLAANKEGALVKTYKWGLFKQITRDVDFTSFYPNLIVQLNLCPTTTRIIETREILEPFSSHLTSDNHLILSIPDNRANVQVIISIDMNKRGIAAEFVREMMADRKAMKHKMKTLHEGSPEWVDLDVNQLNLKVIINALTGMFGLQSALFGSLASYIAITGTGRYILQAVKDHIGDDVISINTDGLYMTDFTPLSELNAWLEGFVKDLSFNTENHIWLEESFFEASYFQPGAEKHYLLLRKSDNGTLELVIHGGGLKGSARIKLFSRALEELGMKMLTSTVTKTDVDDLYARSAWSLEDLTFTRNCKPKSEYKNANDLGMQLINQYEQRFKKEIKGTASLSYVKVREKRGESAYKLVTMLDDIDSVAQQLDYEYYEDEVIKVLERLSLLHLNPRTRKQRSLFDFG